MLRSSFYINQQFLKAAEAHLDMALQPIVNIKNGRVHGYEALVRHVDKLGMRSIDQLFDTAAANDCLGAISDVLQRKALAKFSILKEKHEILYVNIDGRLFDENEHPFDSSETQLRDAGLDIADVCFELSEKYQSIASNDALRKLQGWKTRGIRFAIDDFGQGYSGLKVLYDLNPEILKIDRFFITAIQSDSKKRLFVSTVVDLAHVLGIKVVAEGVETWDELQVCRDIGCDLLQGYFVCRPSLNPDDLRRHNYKVSPAFDRRKDIGVLTAQAALAALQRPRAIHENEDMETVVRIFESHPEVACFPVVDKHDYPRGVISEREIKPILYHPFGRDLLKNKSCAITLRSLVRPCPSVDRDAELPKIMDLVSADAVDGVLVTHETRYAGFIPSSALFKISNMVRLVQASSVNPLSKLPSHQAIADFMSEALLAKDRNRVFCTIDINGFASFNRQFGFRVGDRVIMTAADLLQKQFQHGWFLGHQGGDDFFLGHISHRAIDLHREFASLRRAFSVSVEAFYRSGDHPTTPRANPDDRTTGVKELLSLRAGAVTIPAGSANTCGETIADELNLAKNAAKAAASSFFLAASGDTQFSRVAC